VLGIFLGLPTFPLVRLVVRTAACRAVAMVFCNQCRSVGGSSSWFLLEFVVLVQLHFLSMIVPFPKVSLVSLFCRVLLIFCSWLQYLGPYFGAQQSAWIIFTGCSEAFLIMSISALVISSLVLRGFADIYLV